MGFALGNYDSAQPLVIDPTLNYSTFVGGSSDDSGRALAPALRSLRDWGLQYIAGTEARIELPQ